MSTTFLPLPSIAAASTALADADDAAGVRLAACAAVVCVADFDDGLP